MSIATLVTPSLDSLANQTQKRHVKGPLVKKKDSSCLSTCPEMAAFLPRGVSFFVATLGLELLRKYFLGILPIGHNSQYSATTPQFARTSTFDKHFRVSVSVKETRGNVLGRYLTFPSPLKFAPFSNRI